MSEVDDSYDLRQYRRMLDHVEAYKSGVLNLQGLVDNLDALRSALVSPSKPWLDQFEHQWGILEDVYAVMQDNKEAKITDLHAQLVAQSLDKLEPLIKRQLNYAGESNRTS
jgi:hypothetical protein